MIENQELALIVLVGGFVEGLALGLVSYYGFYDLREWLLKCVENALPTKFWSYLLGAPFPILLLFFVGWIGNFVIALLEDLSSGHYPVRRNWWLMVAPGVLIGVLVRGRLMHRREAEKRLRRYTALPEDDD